ncbi:MAG: hypothetical protein KBC12_00430 [Candidatus Pacebacteria bacterium]|nr:hypothetical protein [Candidatus Paceibacterota bacterium]MBP9851119.1 hypothetical protein [Candidatus Paceibacterota bacterium]
MIEIKDLLSRFEKILGHEVVKIGLIQDTIKDFVGIDIAKDNIKIKSTTLVLNIKPIYKNEILLKKDLILESFEKHGLKIKEIR